MDRKPPAPRSNGRRFPIPMRLLRTGVVLLVAGLFIAGAACSRGYGSLCAFGTGSLRIVCPLGFLGAAFAGRSLLPGLWIAAGLAALLIALFGRFFCAWVCPASLLRSLKIRLRGKPFQREAAAGRGQQRPAPALPEAAVSPALPQQKEQKRRIYSSLAVLGGALASSWLFGFPVFCLVCPVGLVFGIVYAVLHWFAGAQPGLELLIFPIILFAELFLMRSWCSSICPLGALHGLLGGLSLLPRISVRKDECLASKGSHCRACAKACPNGINLGKLGPSAHEPSAQLCSKCLECWQKCPVHAVEIKLLR